MKLTFYALAGALAAALITTTSALAGSGVGGTFNLGQVNTVDQRTTLTGSISNEAQLLLQNNGTGTALSLVVGAGAPPLKVNSDVKVAGLNSDKLDGLDSPALQKRVNGICGSGQAIKVINADGSVTCEPVGVAGAWGLTGNSGTVPGTNFLGTTDNKALELKVNSQRALRLEPSSGMVTLIGGFSGNSVLTGAIAGTIAGGGGPGSPNTVSERFGTVGGGLDNVAGDQDGDTTSATSATVSGGNGNTASGFESTVGGGAGNTAGADYSTVGGGVGNTTSNDYAIVGGGTSNTASGNRSTVGGGVSNVASGFGSTVPGGSTNTAGGSLSFAAGLRAQANQQGAFVWADSQNSDMNSSGADQFIARAQGHFFLQSDSTLDDQNGFINTTTGAFLSTGGTWTNASSRTLKAGFASISPVRILEKVAALPVTSWHYRAEPGVRHIGPVSEDFYRAFGVGDNSRSIGTVDEGGVALAAIKGLYRQNRSLQRENQALRAQLNEQNARLTRLERLASAKSR